MCVTGSGNITFLLVLNKILNFCLYWAVFFLIIGDQSYPFSIHVFNNISPYRLCVFNCMSAIGFRLAAKTTPPPQMVDQYVWWVNLAEQPLWHSPHLILLPQSALIHYDTMVISVQGRRKQNKHHQKGLFFH